MVIDFISYLFISFICGVSIGLIFFILTKQKFLLQNTENLLKIQKINSELEIISQQNQNLELKIKNSERNSEDSLIEKKNLERLNKEYHENYIKQELIIKHINENLKNLTVNLEKIEHENITLKSINSEINCKLSSLESQKEILEQNLKLINDSLLHQFKNIATNIINENNEKFTEESKKKIDTLINPLNEKLQNFQKNMQECFDVESKEKFSLKESISKVIHSNEQIKYEASKLSNALKGNKMTLGHWGEIVLENLLISSGLRKDQDYFLQTNMKSQSNEILKPDVLIKLPDDKYIIIDAKTSFFDFHDYENIFDQVKKDLIIKDFIQRIKNHIENLSSKEYHSSLGIQTPEITLMFIPVESWYNIAIQSYPELYQYAWNKNIAVISPSTLFIILKTVSYIWKGKIQTQNSLKIADQAGKLYDQFVDFLSNMTEIGKSIEKASNNFDKAMSRLQNGRGNLIRRAEQMRTLGINNTKKIDQNLIFHENSYEHLECKENKEKDIIEEKEAAH
jgi:DNA recombination protein RmuC